MGDFNGNNYKDKFISQLVAFVASDGFQSKFEKFFLTYALQFTADEEHKLIYYEIYQEFASMFESELETLMRSLDMTEAEFVRKCRSAREEDPKVNHYIEILLGSVEYDTFVKLMKIMRPVAELRKLNAQRAADAKSAESSPTREGKGGDASPAKAASSSAAASAKGEDSSADAKMIEMDDLSGAKSSSAADSKSDSK